MKKERFVDLHSHFIFGVDDGAYDLEASMAMIEQAATYNFEAIMATPHATELTDDEFNLQILENFKTIQRQVKKEKIPIELYLSAEMFFSQRIFDWLKYPWSSFNNNKKYFLFELPLFDLPEGVGEFIFHSRLKGLIPILAHPERYRYLHNQIEKLTTYIRQGCLVQVNAGSIIGQFGAAVQNFALKLIKSGAVHFVASDAHETKNRNYLASVKARAELAKILDQEVLERLFYQNPLNAITAKEIIVLDFNEEHLLSKPEKWKIMLSRLKKKLMP